MHFTALRIAGFKSFVDATEVPIAPGITGVVGPNGCGKSNLVEALRWVMGEASARRMRGGEMDDVIFGGSTARPARNIAEVTLVLDNADRAAPAAFNAADALEVSRRIERESGSDYRVNGRIVRARDVQLLFQDSNSGSGSPALVSQGRVGSLIAARPAERRLLLEEAAGIQGLHSRRHEAELRLRAAENNLTRLDDIIQAMETQLAGLKRQVRQTVRYRNLSDRIRTLEATLLLIGWSAAGARLLAANDAFARADGEVLAADRAVVLAGKAQADAAADLPALRDAAVAAGAAVQRLSQAGHELEAEARRVADAEAELVRQQGQLAADRAREDTLAEDAAAALARLEAEGEALAAAVSGEGPARTAALAERDRAQGEVEGLDREVARLTAELAAERTRRAALADRVARLKRRRDEADGKHAQVLRQAEALRADIAAGTDLAALEAAIAEEAAALVDLEAAAEDADAALAAADLHLAETSDALRQAEARASRIRAEADGLRALTAGLAADGEGGTPVIAQLAVPPGLETALGAALGDTLDAPADPDATVGWTGLGAAPASLPPLPDGAEPLAERVSAPPELARRLAALGVVEDAAAGDRLAAQLAPGQELVDRDGGVWRWDGFRARAGAPSPGAQRLAQMNRLAALEAELVDALAVAETVAAERESARSARDGAREAAAAARQQVRNRRAELESKRADAARLARLDAERTARLAALQEQAAGLEGDRAAIAQDLAATEGEAAGFGDLAELEEAGAAARAHLADRRATLAARQQAVDALEREAAQRAARRTTIAEELTRWAERASSARERIADLDRRSAAAAARAEELARMPAALAERRARLADQQGEAEAVQRAASDAVVAAETRQAAADKAVAEAQAVLSAVREARVRAEAAIATARTEMDGLALRAAERLNVRPEGLAGLAGIDADAPLPEADTIERQLDRLTAEREAMGPVNLRAETEAAELDAQIAGLLRERGDLTEAIHRLRQAISSLNREARERLLGSFDQVDGHFRGLFTRLFGGGEAHLKLTDAEDPLEAGLDIVASPPGKRLQSLSLLSGGEQALTALALLFAVFLTNPAPICVLDEVDAPLDDANVDRFCGLLDDLAAGGRTRFLVVTHHRMTMARAHRLYGVTMPEQGVSQLVAVDLERARAFSRPGAAPGSAARRG